jgi:Fe2+ or Zn2+ uptake regulation protein
MTAFPSSAASELRAAGLRATSQRALVLEIIRGSQTHLDADEIYGLAHGQDASISLATVYRTLKALRQAGLIEKRYFGPDHAHDHYEAAGEEEHYHLSCSQCGRVQEFKTPAVRRLVDDLQHRHAWRLQRPVLLLEGLCPVCAAQEA